MADPEELSTPQLLTRLSEQTSQLVRAEMQLARAELTQAAKHAGLGAGLFGTAGVVALYGLGVLIAAAVLALALALPAWLAAVIVGVVVLAVAGVLALAGKQQVARAPGPVATSTESIRTDVETVQEARRG